MPGDHPDIPYLQAEHYASGRPDGPPLWIVWHTMEEDELGDTAERVSRFFAFNTGSRTVSSHYCHDADSSVQCVRLADVAFTVGNRPGNYRGINHELAGRASQTAAQWADAYSQSMLRRAAVIAARDMARYRIPNRWCTVDDLKARRPGHTTHNDLRLAFGGTTHTDPGPNFPRAQMLALIEGDDDVSAAEVWATQFGFTRPDGTVEAPAPAWAILRYALYWSWLSAQTTKAIAEKVDISPEELESIRASAREGALAGVNAGTDDLVAAVVAALPDAALTRADVETALRNVLGSLDEA